MSLNNLKLVLLKIWDIWNILRGVRIKLAASDIYKIFLSFLYVDLILLGFPLIFDFNKGNKNDFYFNIEPYLVLVFTGNKVGNCRL